MTKRQKDKTKTKRQKMSLIYWCQGSFALLRCFNIWITVENTLFDSPFTQTRVISMKSHGLFCHFSPSFQFEVTFFLPNDFIWNKNIRVASQNNIISTLEQQNLPQKMPKRCPKPQKNPKFDPGIPLSPQFLEWNGVHSQRHDLPLWSSKSNWATITISPQVFNYIRILNPRI